MIVSFDTIIFLMYYFKMTSPPFDITNNILKYVSEIQEILGEIKILSVSKPTIKLRKENKIKTIHHSLAIEGNSLSEQQITDILDSKRVLGPHKQIVEVKNAIKVYDNIHNFETYSEKDFLKAHKLLMNDLIGTPGKYRNNAVGIFKNGQVSRMAPSAKMVPRLMTDLFKFLKKEQDTLVLLKASIFHYELEFIHPFIDGNGRMGRMWQQKILMKISPIFEHIPVESLIHKNQKKYYVALEESDREGKSTPFLEFSLEMILKSLQEFGLNLVPQKPKIGDRIEYALETFADKSFTRKEYLQLFKNISTATASRDLARAVTEKKIKISGTKANAQYKKI